MQPIFSASMWEPTSKFRLKKTIWEQKFSVPALIICQYSIDNSLLHVWFSDLKPLRARIE